MFHKPIADRVTTAALIAFRAAQCAGEEIWTCLEKALRAADKVRDEIAAEERDAAMARRAAGNRPW